MPWPLDDKPVNPLLNTRVANALANLPEPEMRNASLPAQAYMGFNALGRMFGFPDIAQRSADTLNTVSIPSMLLGLGLTGTIPSDVAIARQLASAYPNEVSAARSIRPRDVESLAALMVNSDPSLHLALTPPNLTALNQNALSGSYKAALEAQGKLPFRIINGDPY